MNRLRNFFFCAKKLMDTCAKRVLNYNSLVLWRSSIRDANGHIIDRYPFLPECYFKSIQPFPNSNSFDGWPYLRRIAVLRYFFLQGVLKVSQEQQNFKFEKWLCELHSVLHPKIGGKFRPIHFRTHVSSPTAHHSVLIGPIADSAVVKKSKFFHFLMNESHEIYTPRLPNIPPEFLPFDKRVDSRIIHSYPHYSSLNIYASAAHKEFAQFSSLYIIGNSPRELLLRHACSFFHYLSIARFFRRGNHSLYMTLFNAMLEILDLPKLQHGCIDFAAIHLDSETFHRYMSFIMAHKNRTAYVTSF